MCIRDRFEGQVLHWKFDDLRLVDKYHRRISNVNDEDARISLDVETWEKLSKLAPNLRNWYFSKSHLKLIGALFAFSVGLILFATYGVQIISHPLATVSYTHLDVYKRQNIRCLVCRINHGSSLHCVHIRRQRPRQ